MSVIDYPSQGTIGTTRKPKRYDIDIYQGDSFSFYLVFQGTGIDVTGWTATSTVKDSTGAVVSNVVTVSAVDTVNKRFTITVNSEIITPGQEYKYDVQVSDASSNKRTYIGGRITADEDITEP